MGRYVVFSLEAGPGQVAGVFGKLATSSGISCRTIHWFGGKVFYSLRQCLRQSASQLSQHSQGIFLIFLLTCAFLILVTVAVHTFQSEAPSITGLLLLSRVVSKMSQVTAALDTGTSFIARHQAFRTIWSLPFTIVYVHVFISYNYSRYIKFMVIVYVFLHMQSFTYTLHIYIYISQPIHRSTRSRSRRNSEVIPPDDFQQVAAAMFGARRWAFWSMGSLWAEFPS